MKNLIQKFIITMFTLCGTISYSFAQSASPYSSVDLGIQFQVPDNLRPVLTDAMFNPFQRDAHYLIGRCPDKTAYLFVFAYDDTSVKEIKFLEKALQQLGHKEDFGYDVNHQERFKVFHAYGLADKEPIVEKVWGPIEISSQNLGVHVITTTIDSKNYIFYLFTDASLYEAYRQSAWNIVGTLAKF